MKSPAYSIPAGDEDSAGDTTRKRTPAFASVLLLRLGGGDIEKSKGIPFRARRAGLLGSRDESSPEIPRCHSSVPPRLTTSLYN